MRFRIGDQAESYRQVTEDRAILGLVGGAGITISKVFNAQDAVPDIIVEATTPQDVRGGKATVHTDGNGQATVVFPTPFSAAPQSLVVTVHNSIVLVGVLVLTADRVTVFVWDVFANAYWKDMDITLYWMALL